jgi:hypothetical protein
MRARAGRNGGLTPALGVILAMAGCDILGPVVCTTEIVPGIVVTVREVGTGVPLAQEATGTVREGGYVGPLLPHEATSSDASAPLVSLRGADERPGTYEVRVEREGYLPWFQTGVRVTRGRCHVQTVHLHADLTPVNGG